MESNKTNWLAIVGCAVVSLLLGMTWYGPIFGKSWMDAQGIVMNEAAGTYTKDGVEHAFSFTPMIVSTLGAIVSGFLLNYLFQRMRVSGWQDGLKTGAVIGVFGLIGTLISNMFSAEPMSLTWIDGGHILVLFAAYGALIGGWQKK